jgi:hypothetical protein
MQMRSFLIGQFPIFMRECAKTHAAADAYTRYADVIMLIARRLTQLHHLSLPERRLRSLFFVVILWRGADESALIPKNEPAQNAKVKSSIALELFGY